jgi:lysylphosphatidylglycerol synthetase-like protein (DUF2156 family)
VRRVDSRAPATTAGLFARLGLALAVTGAQLAAAAIVLGRPNWSRAADFFTDRLPTYASAVAASQLMLSLIVLALFALSLASAVRATLRELDERHRQRLASGLVLLLGTLVLAIGVGHHLSPARVTLGGGSLQEASQELGR